VPYRGARRIPLVGKAADFPALEIFAPLDDVRARDNPEFFRPGDAGEAHKILNGVAVGALGAGVLEIAKPLDPRRHFGQTLKLLGGQKPFGRDAWDRELLVHRAPSRGNTRRARRPAHWP
jgi:hypothetical protein